MILKIKEELLRIQKIMENENLAFEVKRELYLQYIKLSMFLDTKPVFKPDDRDGNCYTYALDIPFPAFFAEVHSSVDFNVGFVHSRFLNVFCTQEKMMLENFYLDCEALKIKTYNSSINSKAKHDGYKIALYFKKGQTPNTVADVHFLRQDIDLSWSEQLGYSGIVQKCETPEQKHILDGEYELVRVLEIVKPTLR